MYCLEYLVSVRKNLVLAVVLQRCFYYWGKGPFLRNAYFSNFDYQKQVSVDSAGKLYLLFLPLGNTLPGNTRILPGILNFYSKIKIKPAGEAKLGLLQHPRWSAL